MRNGVESTLPTPEPLFLARFSRKGCEVAFGDIFSEGQLSITYFFIAATAGRGLISCGLPGSLLAEPTSWDSCPIPTLILPAGPSHTQQSTPPGRILRPVPLNMPRWCSSRSKFGRVGLC